MKLATTTGPNDGPAIAGALPKHTRWRRGRYRYGDVVATLLRERTAVGRISFRKF